MIFVSATVDGNSKDDKDLSCKLDSPYSYKYPFYLKTTYDNGDHFEQTQPVLNLNIGLDHPNNQEINFQHTSP